MKTKKEKKKITKKENKVITKKKNATKQIKQIKKATKPDKEVLEVIDNKPKKGRRKIQDKRLRILRYITFALAGILLIEGTILGIRMYKIRKNSTYCSSINSIVETKNNIVAVGFSDSRHSKFIKYEKPGYNKPYIWVYDKDFKIKNEIQLKLGYNGVFTDIITVDDGYIVVGYLEMSETNHEEGNTEGTIIKYDKDFKVVWRTNIDVLGNTRLNSVKQMPDGTYMVAGASVYANDVIGNHTNGGAIVVRYNDKGEQLSITNYGGPKTGEFNDIELLDDGYIVVGVRSKGTGIIFKYNYNGSEIWHNYYGYTDQKGLTSITKINNNEFIVTGSKLDEKDKNDNYKAALLKHDGNGKLIDEQLYQKNKITRFQDSIVIGENIYVVGLYGQQVDQELDNDSVLVTYTKDLNQIEEKIYEGNKTYTINKIFNYKDSYLVVGHTNSKLKELKTNGLDYYQVLVK